ncbi:MAG TPA: RpiB/LacA/LacB family sugar-phosphate isomerase [Candidatus Paceibacterota bacterium]|jgi:ribose 5-phosphate isomerase B|nr:RpiB/LacA/LacB family sugar-phosphate isomerase [Candidatus Paceibacterota bacterium]
MKLFVASDHAGYELKQKLTDFLLSQGHEVEDCGPSRLNPADDYPDYIGPCAHKVADTHGSFGIVIGLSGQGEAMAANRVRGARAAVYYGGPADILKLSRQHNDANILSLGARFVSFDEASKAVTTWLDTHFEHDERHQRRILKMDYGG